MQMKSPFFIALDLEDRQKIDFIVESTKSFVGGFKVGPRLLFKFGPEYLKELCQTAPVFVDHKFYDIPNTMVNSVRTAFDCGASFVTVHAGSGAVALKKMAELEAELSKIRPFKVLAVTALTSFDESSRPTHWQEKNIEEHVKLMAQATADSGLTGFVCSPFEVGLVKAILPEAFVVTPGIRLDGDDSDDQKRIMTPEKAIQAGASALVIGRSIVKSAKPAQVAQSIFERVSL